MRRGIVLTSCFLVFAASADDGDAVLVASRDADVVALVDLSRSLVVAEGDLCADARRAFAMARALRYGPSQGESLSALARLASCGDPVVSMEASASALSVMATPSREWEDAMDSSQRAETLTLFERLANDAATSEDVKVASRAVVDHFAAP